MDIKLKDQIREALNTWLDDNNPERSAARLSDISGINRAYISNIKNGKYDINGSEIPEAKFRQVAEHIGFQIDNSIHWKTDNFQYLMKVCSRSQALKKITLVDSDESGLGKSYTLDYYHYHTDKVLYIRCTKTMTAKDLLNDITNKLNMKHKLVGNYAKMSAIRTRLIASPGWMIIIDEVENVKTSVYEAIKELVDYIYGKCAMIVCGMGIVAKINRLAERGRVGFPQLRRRLFTNIARVEGMQKGEIIRICESHDIKTRSAHEWFVENVHDFQMLREYISDAVAVAAKKNVVIDRDFLANLFTITYKDVA